MHTRDHARFELILAGIAVGALVVWIAVFVRSPNGRQEAVGLAAGEDEVPVATDSLEPELPAYAEDSVFRPHVDRLAPLDPQRARPATRRLAADDARPFSYFGHAVALAGDLAVVGAPYDDGEGVDAGAAYLFARQPDGWRQAARLISPHPRPLDRFGIAVAVSSDGTAVAVGADRVDRAGADDCGAVYLFERTASGWSAAATLTAPESAAGDGLGLAVAVDGALLLAGAPGSGRPPGAGAVLAFRRTAAGWRFEEELAAPAPLAAGQFGKAVALSGDTAVIGAPSSDRRGLLAGDAWVLRRRDDRWHSEGPLDPSSPPTMEKLGSAVAAAGDRVLVGAPRARVGGSGRAGVGYLFERTVSGWSEVARLSAPQPRSDEEVGRAVALAGGTAILGTNFGDHLGLNTGVAYLAQEQPNGAWSWQTIVAGDAAAMDEFGTALAASSGLLLIGAPRHHGGGNAAGAAYFLSVTDQPNTTAIERRSE